MPPFQDTDIDTASDPELDIRTVDLSALGSLGGSALAAALSRAVQSLGQDDAVAVHDSYV